MRSSRFDNSLQETVLREIETGPIRKSNMGVDMMNDGTAIVYERDNQ